LITASGHEIQARRAPLPASLAPTGETVALAVVPAKESVRRIAVRGRVAGGTPLTLPAAARQCGYGSSFVTLALP
jgi:hypothetical protein